MGHYQQVRDIFFNSKLPFFCNLLRWTFHYYGNSFLWPIAEKSRAHGAASRRSSSLYRKVWECCRIDFLPILRIFCGSCRQKSFYKFAKNGIRQQSWYIQRLKKMVFCLINCLLNSHIGDIEDQMRSLTTIIKFQRYEPWISKKK